MCTGKWGGAAVTTGRGVWTAAVVVTGITFPMMTTQARAKRKCVKSRNLLESTHVSDAEKWLFLGARSEMFAANGTLR
jgi:hypothetical protein